MAFAPDEVLLQLLEQCRLEIASKKPSGEVVQRIREILEKSSIGRESLLDVLTALNSDFSAASSSAESTSEIRKFLHSITDELIPSEILSLELNVLGAEDVQAKSRIVKSKTRIYFKQLKFNLLREESEGYAKLITEVLSVNKSTSAEQLLVVIESLIGQFNLDPNRVLDLILDCFEQCLQHKDLFVRLLRKFKVEPDELCKILVLKFIFCQKGEHTPMDLYRVASVLCQENLLDFVSLFNMLSPSQKVIIEEHKRLMLLVKTRCSKAEAISTGQLASESVLTAAANAMNGPDLGGPEPISNVIPTVSFSAAASSQDAEDKKLAGSNFDDNVLLAKNQKLGLICALLEHGAWEMARDLIDLLPEQYVIGVSRRISKAVANLIGYSIEPFYRLKHPDWRPQPIKQKSSWDNFIHPVEQVTCWENFVTIVGPLAMFIGPYIGVRHEVAIKLMRLIGLYFTENKAVLQEANEVSIAVMDICDCALVPGASMLDSNFSYTEELWQILSQFPYHTRFWLYGRWKSVHTARCWDLAVQRSKVLGMTKYAMKRLSKETAKVIGRQLGKLGHTYPSVALAYMLDKVQDFQNFIGPVVESLRFLSNLELDILSYCLIESLADPEKAPYKTTDVAFSPWLQSLANFSAAVFRRYSIDFSGLIQYIANQLKDRKNLDMIVLREIIANISGVEAGTDITNDHLEALCGFDWLRQEAGYVSLAKVNKRATNRLKDALLQADLLQSLCILIGQQKNIIIFEDSKTYPLKLTAHMLDQCQETFVQFHHFVRSVVKSDEYTSRIPTITQLLGDYHLPIEAAMFLTRSNYLAKINSDYESSKKSTRDASKTKLDEETKYELYKKAFEGVWRELERELISHYKEEFFIDLNFELFSVFWLLSASDMYVPKAAYERELEKCRKELADITAQSSESSSRARRNAKDEERLKTLEQKITDEMNKQIEHVQRIKRILADHSRSLFAQQQKSLSQMLRFFQKCILPRVIFSEVDAVYCARLIETLHFNKTEFFQTFVFYDKIFIDVTPFLSAFTERETNCFGRFCCMCLDVILRWHSSKDYFEAECEGFPGCMTKVRNPAGEKSTSESVVESSPVPFSYEFFRSACYKWQIKVARSLVDILANQNYVMIRNALTFMMKILPNFPVLQVHYTAIVKSVITVRDNEKGKRQDLNVLASSYLVKLQKRNIPLKENKDFYDLKTTKLKPPPVAGPNPFAPRKRPAEKEKTSPPSKDSRQSGRSAIIGPNSSETPPQTPSSGGGSSSVKKRARDH